MRAIQVTQAGGPETLRLVDVPVRDPGPGEVLVRTHTIGVGKPDVLFRTGVYRWMPPLPAIIGAEASGHVEAVGEGVEEIALGDAVLVSYAPVGCYAEYVTAPLRNVLKLPADVDLADAVHIPNYVTGYALLTDAPAGMAVATLFMNGAAGGVGAAVVQMAALREITVIAAASTDEKCAFVRGQGAAHVINYRTTEVVPEVLRLTGGEGVDLILDHFVGPNFTDNLEMLAPLGMIVSFNVLGGFPENDLFRELRAHLPKSPAVRCFSAHVYDKRPARLKQIQLEVIELLRAGKLAPPVHARLPLAEARAAHELLDRGQVLGKLVLQP